jgi:hypothetical protein
MICNRQILSGLIKFSETAVHVARMGEKGNAYRVSVEKREQNELLRRSGRRWEDILKRILILGWEVVELTHLAQERNRSRLFSKR